MNAAIENRERENHEIHETHEKDLFSCVSCISWFSKEFLRRGFGAEDSALLLSRPWRKMAAHSSMKAALPRVMVGMILTCGLALAADWRQGEGCRSAELKVPPGGRPGFQRLLPPTTGIYFTNSLPWERFRTNQILLNGSGVAAGDVDGDGWCDLYFCRLDGANALYRNLSGWKFQDITASSGVGCAGYASTGAVLADLDGDGDLDLVVNTVGHGTHIFINDGKGHFTERTKSAPLNPGKGGMSLAVGDVDGDGWLDIYVVNYRTGALMDMPNARFWLKTIGGKKVIATVNGRPVTEPDLANRFVVNALGGISELGEVDAFYLNQGGTNLAAVSFLGGAFLDEDGRPLTSLPYEWGLSAMMRDLNQDGLPDIYVCNDFDSPDRIWINQGQGRFRLAPRLALRKSTMFSMAIDAADLNRDGWDDLFALDMLSRHRIQRLTTMPDSRTAAPVIGRIDNRPQYMMNMLFLNRGDGTYAEIGQLGQVRASEWSWAVACLDVDLDGWEDLLISNGNERESRHMDVANQIKAMRAQRQLSVEDNFDARRLFPRYATANVAFRNRRDLTFEEAGRQWGFDWAGVSHGIALADLDNDGDQDVVVNNLNDAAAILRNQTSAPRVAVRLKGRAPNTAGIGARITARGGPVTQAQEIMCGGRYLSSDEPMRVFAAGTATNVLTLEVAWRGGGRSVVANVAPNRIYEIVEPAADEIRNPKSEVRKNPEIRNPNGEATVSDAGSPATNYFIDVSHLLKHTHQEEPFDDFARQPTLARQLSQLGPGVTWCDLDGDGREELVIASGKGGYLAAYHNDGHGGFKPWNEPPFTQPVTRDQTTVLPWPKPGGATALIVGSANYEDGLAVGGCARAYDLAQKKVEDLLPGQPASTGPLAMADIDGDGDLDLFVGGRCLPGKYPEAAASLLFRQADGSWQPDAENNPRLANLGLVSAAVFSDLDGDGDPDLVLACEWGPLKIFQNDHGRFTPWSFGLSFATLNPQLSTLNSLLGWWNGVTTGDFDGDGRLDIVASNWGRNTRYEWHRRQPLQAWYSDWDEDGTAELVESYFDDGLNKWVPERGLDSLARAFPFLREQFKTHSDYAAASLEELFGDRLKTMRHWDANWLESTLFLNRGTQFLARPLPIEAQMAPVFGLCVGDFDGDGHDDLFLSQNFFALPPETPRCDAGRGLWLRNDGVGNFTAVSGQESGIKVYGEQRGCALADFDGDGRVDLAVSQNGAETKLYKNTGARPGLRVRLKGGPSNPAAIGAVVRVERGGRWGPAREIHAGGGYWSHDSPVPVLGAVPAPTRVQVRWPGGKEITAPVPGGAKEIIVELGKPL